MGRERRPLLVEEPSAEPGHFGCPMLMRSHIEPAAGELPLMRCALAWALHNPSEVARCAATVAVTDCWKVHPERLVVVEPPIFPGATAVDRTAPRGDEPEARSADD